MRAGRRVTSGRAVAFAPRPYSRGSLVSEEDRSDTYFRWILLIATILLGCSDLLMEFGSSTAEVSTGRTIVTGYELAREHVPIEVVSIGRGQWAPTAITPVGHRTTYRVRAFKNAPEDGVVLTTADFLMFSKSRSVTMSGGQTAETPEEWTIAGGTRLYGSRGERLLSSSRMIG